MVSSMCRVEPMSVVIAGVHAKFVSKLDEPMKVLLHFALSEQNLELHSSFEQVAIPSTRRVSGPPGIHTPQAPPGVHFQRSSAPVRPAPGLELHSRRKYCPSDGGASSTALPSDSSDAEVIEFHDEDGDSLQRRTTVVMRNLPKQYSRDMLVSLLDSQGFAGTYRLVYLPIAFATGLAIGYAFVTFGLHETAARFKRQLEGFQDWACKGNLKACEVQWRNGFDGLNELVQHFRNCPVMHPSVPDSFRPALFEKGTQVTFPTPTHAIKKPRNRVQLD